MLEPSDKKEILSYIDSVREEIALGEHPALTLSHLRRLIRMEAAASRSPFCVHCGLPVFHTPTKQCTGIELEEA